MGGDPINTDKLVCKQERYNDFIMSRHAARCLPCIIVHGHGDCTSISVRMPSRCSILNLGSLGSNLVIQKDGINTVNFVFFSYTTIFLLLSYIKCSALLLLFLLLCTHISGPPRWFVNFWDIWLIYSTYYIPLYCSIDMQRHEMIRPDIFRINSVSLVAKEW